jgi:hypothetical protein
VGKTVPSYRIALENEIKKWEGFSKALRSQDKEAFEQMMNACRIYASAAGNATRPVLIEPMFMSILLAHQKMLMEIKKDLESIKQRFNQP